MRLQAPLSWAAPKPRLQEEVPKVAAPQTPPTRGSAHATLVVMFGIGVSRVFGLVREQVVAFYFGRSAAYSAFVAAYKVPNLVRVLLGEGNLSASFIPVLAEGMRAGDAGPDPTARARRARTPPGGRGRFDAGGHGGRSGARVDRRAGVRFPAARARRAADRDSLSHDGVHGRRRLVHGRAPRPRTVLLAELRAPLLVGRVRRRADRLRRACRYGSRLRAGVGRGRGKRCSSSRCNCPPCA